VHETRSRALFSLQTGLLSATRAWQPQADIYRAPDGWVVKLELAGVRPQDVSVTVCGSQLHIAGVRYDWIVEDGWRHQAMEIAYNRFARTIDLPHDLAQARITAECRDGMLLLRVTIEESPDHV
jgi:HSP20 family protein